MQPSNIRLVYTEQEIHRSPLPCLYWERRTGGPKEPWRKIEVNDSGNQRVMLRPVAWEPVAVRDT